VNKIYPLESLRGFAALVVVLFHTQAQSFLVQNPLVRAGFTMVDLFFVLSGFVIALSYAERIKDPSDAWTFQVRRFWRLYPLHLAVMLCYIAAECAKLALTSETPFDGRNDAGSLFASLLLVHPFVSDRLVWNYPSWSIAMEFAAYALFAVTCVLARSRLVLAAAAIVAVSGFWLVQNGMRADTFGVSGFMRCVFSFFLGVLTWRASKLVQTVPNWLVGATLAAAVLAVCNLDRVPYVILPVAFAALILSVAKARDDSLVRQVLSLKPAVFLGTISYSVYMVHAFGLLVLEQAPKAKLGEGWLRTIPEPYSTLVVLGFVAGVLGVATLTYRHIEDRFRKGLAILKPVTA
jgi:peptidoglycan/LPS O-acetylase OafA/YrhL